MACSGELQRRLDKDPALSNISVLGVDPGGMPTTLARRWSWLGYFSITYMLPPIVWILGWFNPGADLRTTWQSASDVLRGVLDTETLGEHPKRLYLNGRVEKALGVEALDAKKQAVLWRDSVGYAKLQAGETVLVDWK